MSLAKNLWEYVEWKLRDDSELNNITPWEIIKVLKRGSSKGV